MNVLNAEMAEYLDIINISQTINMIK